MNKHLILSFISLVTLLEYMEYAIADEEGEEEACGSYYVATNPRRNTVIVDLLVDTNRFGSINIERFLIQHILVGIAGGPPRIYNADLWKMNCGSGDEPFHDARKSICLIPTTGQIKTTSSFNETEDTIYRIQISGSGYNTIRRQYKNIQCYVNIYVGQKMFVTTKAATSLPTSINVALSSFAVSSSYFSSSWKNNGSGFSAEFMQTNLPSISTDLESTPFHSAAIDSSSFLSSDRYTKTSMSTVSSGIKYFVLPSSNFTTLSLEHHMTPSLSSSLISKPTLVGEITSIKLISTQLTSSIKSVSPMANSILTSTLSPSSSIYQSSILQLIWRTTATPECQADSSVGQKTSKLFNWPATLAGMTSRLPCPESSDKTASRSCQRESSATSLWGSVHDSDCPLPQAKRANQIAKMAKVEIVEANAVEISRKLANMTEENPKTINITELKDIISIIGNLINFPEVSHESLSIIDNVLSANESTLEKAQKVYNTSSKLLNMIPNIISSLLPSNANTSNVTLTKNNFVAGLAREGAETFSGITMGYTFNSGDGNMMILRGSQSTTGQDNSIHLPMSISEQSESSDFTNSSLDFVFVGYSNGKLFKKTRVNSKPICANLIGKNIRNLSAPIVIKVTVKEEDPRRNSLCSWWDLSQSAGQGEWSTEGCWLHKKEVGTVTCHCNHLTNFAVLLGAQTPPKTGRETHKQALSIISYTGCAISLAGAIFTLISYIVFPRLRDENPPKILMNLCIAYILLLSVYIVGVTRTETKAGCQAFSAFLHYFLLSVFTWSAVEGFNSFRGLVKPMAGEIRKFIRKAIAFAWGTPVILVTVGMSIWPDSYGDKQSCVVRNLPFYTTLLSPIILILIINFGVLIWIMKSLNETSQRHSHNAITGRERLRIITAFILLFGLTWVFGFLVVSNDILAFQYIFCILNSLQGFFIFLFYCVRSPSVRNSWKGKLGIGMKRPRSDTNITCASTLANSNTPASRKREAISIDSPIYFNRYAVEKNPALDNNNPIYEEVKEA